MKGDPSSCSSSSAGVIESELCRVIGALKSSSKSNEVEALIQRLSTFKRDFSRGHLTEAHFLSPFLEVVRTDPVTAPVTGLALDSIHKFLAYGYITQDSISSHEAQDLAVTVAHAKFMGVDQGSDEVVLMKVLEVLRSLMLSPVGHLLTDESVCEILQSTFRICVEPLLSELLRKMAEASLVDMIRVLFGRLSDLPDRAEGFLPSLKRLKMISETGGYPSGRLKRGRSALKKPRTEHSKRTASVTSGLSSMESEAAKSDEELAKVIMTAEPEGEDSKEFVNTQGVTFLPTKAEIIDESGALLAYGIPCIRELFRFLISLTDPYKPNVEPTMIEVALSLLSTALEVGGKDIEKFGVLLNLVKDDLARNISRLIGSEYRGIFSSNLRLAFLLFSFFRRHLKFQLELFFQKLMDVITSESIKVLYEHKETALDLVVRLYRLPDFITQVYLNYDCDIYTSNIFEDLTKMLSKNTFPLMGLHSTHFLSLDALLAVIESIEGHCHKRMLDVKKEGNAQDGGSQSSTLTHEQLMALKHKKKLIGTATEQFNTKPSKGIAFMQDSGLFQNPLEPLEVASFLRENPHLDKKQLGDYISNRKNLHILEAFVKSFDFGQVRIDEALRLFLETFRLPGEAPLITLIMEHFADHWQKSNGDPLSSSDSAFTLAYAVIMLNVDQHNVNHTKKNDPMTLEQFCRNLRGTNGGSDHDEDMLAEVYHNIRTNEIVMPAEQSGVVRENYLWKCVLKRGLESDFLESSNGTFDHELFGITWGPTIAALSYVFDKAENSLDKSLGGFQKCATIAAHYSMIDVFDNLIISLCKFTTLLSVEELSKNSPFLVSYGSNEKALAATRLVVSLVVKHGDILREGWKNILECMLQLFRAGFLPETLTHAEDYLDPKGFDLLNIEDEHKNSKVESGFLNSFVSFISMASEQQARPRTAQEEEAVQLALNTVSACNLESIITESKFLVEESLTELVKALINGANSFLSPPAPVSPSPSASTDEGISNVEEGSDPLDEGALLFLNEILVRVTLENRDRVTLIWKSVLEHLVRHISSGCLVERAVTNILRLCVRLARKEDLASMVLASGLKVLLSMNHSPSVSRIVAYGLYELLRNNAANIHESSDWGLVFDLMDSVGAGVCSVKDEEWIVLGSQPGLESPSKKEEPMEKKKRVKSISVHDSPSFLKCCESLSFLVRDVAHITPHNFEACVATLRLFVEAVYFGIRSEGSSHGGGQIRTSRKSGQMRRIKSAPNSLEANYDADESESDPGVEDSRDSSSSGGEYHHVSLRLLDLMQTLHSRAGSVYEAWGARVDLWALVWCPLLQDMSRLCTDHRPQIRTAGLTALQRSLLHTDLRRALSPTEWESAFTAVLFPMLSRLLEIQAGSPGERGALEETRTRAATLLGKVFLQHLTPLTQLSTFNALWLTILDFMEKFIASAKSDVLADAIPESLKNMLLVMDTAGTFLDPVSGEPAPLWGLTWDKLHVFLPNLMAEIFGSRERSSKPSEEPDKGIAKPQDNMGALAGLSEENRVSEPQPGEQSFTEGMTDLPIESRVSEQSSSTEMKGPRIESQASEPQLTTEEKEPSSENRVSHPQPMEQLSTDAQDIDPPMEKRMPEPQVLEQLSTQELNSPSSEQHVSQPLEPVEQISSEEVRGPSLDKQVSEPQSLDQGEQPFENRVSEPQPLLNHQFSVEGGTSFVNQGAEPQQFVAEGQNPLLENRVPSETQPLEQPLSLEEGQCSSSSVPECHPSPTFAVDIVQPQRQVGEMNATAEVVPQGNKEETVNQPVIHAIHSQLPAFVELPVPEALRQEGQLALAQPYAIPEQQSGFMRGPSEPPATHIPGSTAIFMPSFLPSSTVGGGNFPSLGSLGVIPPPPVVSISQPPPGILAPTGFTPIHAAEPPGGPIVPLASPKALLPDLGPPNPTNSSAPPHPLILDDTSSKPEEIIAP